MRIFGALLIGLGLIICLTIIGIPLGVFLIFVGIVLVAIGSRRAPTITNVVQVSTTPSQQSLSTETDTSGERLTRPPQQRPVIDVTPSTHIVASPSFDYDRVKWDALVTYDDDIAQVEKRLQVLGQQWVDKFAKAYLAINDKGYLPMILNKIVSEAREQT